MPRRYVQRPLTEDEKRVVEENMRLVYKIARQRTNSSLPFDDRVQAGARGLMRAAQKYDPARAAFSTYAHRWIRNMIQAAERADGVVHVPSWVRYDHGDADAQARADRLRGHAERALMMVGGVVDDDVAGAGSSEAPVDDADEIAWLLGKLDRLTARQREVLRAVFWDGDADAVIGRRYGVSRQRAWLWKERALSHLKAMYDDEYAKGA